MSTRLAPLFLALVPVVVAGWSCSSPDPTPETGTVVDFDLNADLSQADQFFRMPWPSDLRLSQNGTPDLSGFPNPLDLTLVSGLAKAAQQRKGFPQISIAQFHFSAALAAQDSTKVIAPDKSSPLLLVDVDDKSPERGRLFPVVAFTPPADRYLEEGTLSIAPRPGFVLHENRKYAFVVRAGLKDAAGKDLAVSSGFSAMKALEAPAADPGLRAWKSFEPLWPTLRQINVDPTDVVAATVFTTGDVVQELADLSSAVRQKYGLTITDIAVDPTDGAKHDRFCELKGKIVYPQFQTGAPPFDTQGIFDIGSDGLPVKQRDETAPVSITLPKTAMPVGGYPLVLYFHGSGGLSDALVDEGPSLTPTDEGTIGEGPAFVLSPHGFAVAGSALPVNPERFPGAIETQYLNFNNLASFRDIFRQGVVEQRMFIDALEKVTIEPSVVAACTGLSLPTGETSYHFSMTPLLAQGQSMGGMYTNLVSAVEPRIKASVPTGAGGFWGYMVLTTKVVAGAAGKLKIVLGTGDLTFLHPTLSLLETAWEVAEPYVFMPRLAHRPLLGHTARSIYEPVGKDDRYFSTGVYDGAALAYGHVQAGNDVWPSMQEALKLDSRDGIKQLPISENMKSEGGETYTAVVLQYNGDGIADPHSIYRQLDAVKYQYGCFLETFRKKGVATIPAPDKLGTPCPGL
ncbi:hypothetical protein BH09MYX1_BH09MYX1_41510 [soil metagenome]